MHTLRARVNALDGTVGLPPDLSQMYHKLLWATGQAGVLRIRLRKSEAPQEPPTEEELQELRTNGMSLIYNRTLEYLLDEIVRLTGELAEAKARKGRRLEVTHDDGTKSTIKELFETEDESGDYKEKPKPARIGF